MRKLEAMGSLPNSPQGGQACDERRGPHPFSREGGDRCECGREIIRGSNTGRRPTRCTVCRKVPPPPYEEHNRDSGISIGPDGWPNPAPRHPQTLPTDGPAGSHTERISVSDFTPTRAFDLADPASGHRRRTETTASTIEKMRQQ